jgi:hypothetical protein
MRWTIALLVWLALVLPSSRVIAADRTDQAKILGTTAARLFGFGR